MYNISCGAQDATDQGLQVITVLLCDCVSVTCVTYKSELRALHYSYLIYLILLLFTYLGLSGDGMCEYFQWITAT